jgi:uncharacterized protein YbjQ (UPF0145 family)
MTGFLVFTLLLALGLVAGHTAERRHYASIRLREQTLLRIPSTTTKDVPPHAKVIRTELAVGSVVVSVDYFKQFVAGLRILVGGELGSYAPLLDRARREALLRMKESCPGADLFVNMRLQTATMSGNGSSSLGTVEVMAYATAVYFAAEHAPEVRST